MILYRWAFQLVCILVLGLFYNARAQSLSICQEGSMLISTINDHHIKPITNDSLWSISLFNKVFESVDPNREIFTKKDINSLKEFSYLLTEKTLKKNCQFVEKVELLYQQRLKMYESFIDSLSSVTSNQFSDGKTSLFMVDKTFCDTLDELYSRWETRVSVKVILQTINIGKSNKSDFSEKDFNTYRSSGQNKVLRKELKQIQKQLKDESFIRDAFLRAIAQNFDPHTEFFPLGEISSFQNAIDKTTDSFGVQFGENQMGEVIVTRIIPAGSAWKSNSIHNGDQLIKLKYSNGLLLEASDYHVDEINELLSSTGHSAEFTFKRTDGQVITVRLEKSKLENTENSISSYLLNGQKKVGYISLPSFYTNSEDVNDNGCANDVAKEIIKLKKENIDGLILDLRFNGGGSMYEAIALAGIFIDYGTLALIELADKSIISLKDLNKGTVYDGPLIVMVNSASASASELVAVALQDHNRALIVGTPTYGKATGQAIYPAKKEKTLEEHTEFIKITMERIYRVSGESYQNQGVKVDFTLPDLTEAFVNPESSFQNTIVNSPIVKKVYFSPGEDLQLSSLQRMSESRVKQSEEFKTIATLSSKLKSPIPINLQDFLNYLEDIETLYAVLEKFDNNQKFRVSQNHFENDLLLISEYQKDISKKNIQEIQNSFYIDEAYQILSDYLEQLEK